MLLCTIRAVSRRARGGLGWPGAWVAGALAAAVTAGFVQAASAQALKPAGVVPEAGRDPTEMRPGKLRASGVPRDIGLLLEVTEEARQSGLRSVRYVRNVGNTLFGWVNHLRISIAENDNADIRVDRTNCELLYELLQQSDPSALMREAIEVLRKEVQQGGLGDPISASLALRLEIQRFGNLYPLQDIDHLSDEAMRLLHEGNRVEALATLDQLQRAIDLPNLDGPIQRSLAVFKEAIAAAEKGRDREARQLLRNAANYASHLNIATYLAECSWYLAKADDALRRDRGGLALAAVRDADTLLRDAEDHAWKDFKPRIAAVRQDSRRLIRSLSDRDLKTTLSTEEVRALAQRIETELRIPS